MGYIVHPVTKWLQVQALLWTWMLLKCPRAISLPPSAHSLQGSFDRAMRKSLSCEITGILFNSCISEFNPPISPLDLMWLPLGRLPIHQWPLDFFSIFSECFNSTKWAHWFLLILRTAQYFTLGMTCLNLQFCLLSFKSLLHHCTLFLSWVTLTPWLRSLFVKSHLALERQSFSMARCIYENQFRSGLLFCLQWGHIGNVADLAGNCLVGRILFGFKVAWIIFNLRWRICRACLLIFKEELFYLNFYLLKGTVWNFCVELETGRCVMVADSIYKHYILFLWMPCKMCIEPNPRDCQGESDPVKHCTTKTNQL